MSERNDLPSITAPNFDQRVRETLQTYLGRQGDPLDRGLTLRDLIENGIVQLPDGWRLRSGSGSVPLLPGGSLTSATGTDTEPDLTPPPTPTGFTASGGISYFIVQHDNPAYTAGGGHLRTRLYGATRAAGAPAPVFADAVEIAQFTGITYAHVTNPATTWHLWIRWQTAAGVLSASPAGGTNGVVVTTAQDVSRLLTALTGQITQSQLFADLGARIDLIDGPVSLAGSVAARVYSEEVARIAADTALGSSITTLQSTTSTQATQITSLTTRVGTAESSIVSLQNTTASQATTISSLNTRVGTAESNITSLQTTTANQATSISTLSSTVSGNTTSIQTLTSTTNGLSGQYTVKIDTNGYVTGYGLASTAVNGTPTSSFIVRANSFSIASPSGPGISPIVPFIVRTTPTTVNGVSVPAGVYIDGAYIQGGSIQGASIAGGTIEDSKLINVSANKITGAALVSTSFIESAGYVAGVSGWKIHGNGTAEFANGTFRGTVIASAGSIGGVTIASSSISANYSAGSSGFRLNSDGSAEFNNLTLRGKLVAGSPLANQVEVGANVTNPGHHGLSLSGNSFANCFIRRESDGAVFFNVNSGGSNALSFNTVSGILSIRGDVEASSLKANTVMVQTLNIAGSAVTVPIYGSSFVDTRTYNSGWYTVLTMSVPVSGLQSGEFVGLIVNSVSSLYPADSVATDVTLGVFINGVLVTELAASIDYYGFSHAGAGYALVGNGSNTIEFKYRSNLNKSMTILTYATALAGKR